MPDDHAPAALLGGVALLERAVGYAVGGLRLIRPADLSLASDCAGWDVRGLLWHLTDSVQAVYEALDTGRLDPLAVGAAGGTDDPIEALRSRASGVLGACAAGVSGAGPRGPIAVADRSLTRGILTSAGALEIAVHGWDLAHSCGLDHPIPAELADELLDLAPILVTDGDRPGRFAPPRPVAPGAASAARLLAYLGRAA